MNLKQKKLNILVILCSILFIGWGNVAHQIINRNATLSFPKEMNFLICWANGLAEHGSDADKRKSSDPSEANKHYIDIDNFPEFLETGKISQSLDSMVIIHGHDYVMKQGILPWAIIATFDSLEIAFRNCKWEKAMLLAADLGHYVGDAHMPLHLTRNYDGQFTNQKGVHSRYESRMIEKYSGEFSYKGDSVAYVTDVSDYVFNMIYDNYVYVDSVLIADSTATALTGSKSSNNYYAKLWELSGSFTIQLFSSASKKLAELIYTSWVDAGSPDPRTDIDERQQPINNFVLHQNYPNPFNSQTNIAFELDKQAEISIAIFNVKGQMVTQLFTGEKEAGYHAMNWDAGNVGAGMYIIRMEAGDFIEMKKCALIK